MAAIELFSTSLFGDANLKAYYRLEANSNDSKGSNNGTDTTITYAAAKFNNGAVSDATTDRIYFANPADYQVAGSQTLVFWIKGSSQGANLRTISASGGLDSASDAALYIYHSVGQAIVFGLSNGTVSVETSLDATATSNLLNGSFHHIAYVFTASTKIEVYVDGVSASSNSTSIPSTRQTNKNWSIFAVETDQSATRRDAFQGTIDDYAFFNRVLTPTEISTLALGATVVGGSPGLMMGI